MLAEAAAPTLRVAADPRPNFVRTLVASVSVRISRAKDVSDVSAAVSSPLKYGSLSAAPANEASAVSVASSGCIFSGTADQFVPGGVVVFVSTRD